MRCLLVIQEDKIPDTEVIKKSHCEIVFSLLERGQLKWTGHGHRMGDTRIEKTPLVPGVSWRVSQEKAPLVEIQGYSQGSNERLSS